MKLLVVDDEANVREMMRLTLEAADYDIDEAESGEAALEKFGDGTAYGAVLLDQKMPGLDGLETMKRLLAIAPDARVVMVTAYASIELAVDAMRQGAAHFLRKPMTPEMLRGAVAAALAGGAPHAVAARRAVTGGAAAARVETLTLNGFRIEPADAGPGAAANAHLFSVTRYPNGPAQTVIVDISPEAVARVARLTKRQLAASGAYWRNQAERRLSAHLWTEGQLPESGRLIVAETDVSRDDIDVAAAWTAD
jgi:FixJ family two-component response regulator